MFFRRRPRPVGRHRAGLPVEVLELPAAPVAARVMPAEPVASRAGRVQLVFRDGSELTLDSASAQGRPFLTLAAALTARG